MIQLFEVGDYVTIDDPAIEDNKEYKIFDLNRVESYWDGLIDVTYTLIMDGKYHYWSQKHLKLSRKGKIKRILK